MDKERWEYATISYLWTIGTEPGEPGVVYPDGMQPESVASVDYTIRRPGKEVDRRHSWSSKSHEEPEKVLLFDLLNELGEEGWELMTDTISESALNQNAERAGGRSSSVPLERIYVLKRRK